jgi:hypothetical protein
MTSDRLDIYERILERHKSRARSGAISFPRWHDHRYVYRNCGLEGEAGCAIPIDAKKSYSGPDHLERDGSTLGPRRIQRPQRPPETPKDRAESELSSSLIWQLHLRGGAQVSFAFQRGQTARIAMHNGTLVPPRIYSCAVIDRRKVGG